MVGDGEEVRIKEQKCKSVWHVGRGVILHVTGKFTTIPLLPPHPQRGFETVSRPLICAVKIAIHKWKFVTSFQKQCGDF